MLPAEIQTLSDSELARKVQESASNEAMCEIINRHTGIYLNVVNGFKLPSMVKDDLKDQKDTNIYSYTLDYKPDKGMKLSTYFYNRARWDCMKEYNDAPDTEEIDNEKLGSESFTYNDEESVKNACLKVARSVGGRDFERVVEARHFGECGTQKLSWHLIPEVLKKGSKSHEWARKTYYLHLDKFKDGLIKEFNYIPFYLNT
jgi:hypothetical protein